MSGHGGNGGEGRNYGEYRDAMVAAIGMLPPPLPVAKGLSVGVDARVMSSAA